MLFRFVVWFAFFCNIKFQASKKNKCLVDNVRNKTKTQSECEKSKKNTNTVSKQKRERKRNR